MSQFLSTYRDQNYYFGNFTYGPVTQYTKILSDIQGGGTTPNVIHNLQNDFDITERIWAGYAMNTISFGRLRLQAGVRVESTADALRANQLNFDPTNGNFIGAAPLTSNNISNDAGPVKGLGLWFL